MIFSFSRRYFALLALSIFPITSYASDTLMKQATYYSDAFQGSQTANGELFDQSVYSAAICDIPLGQYLYVAKGNTGIVVDANDRPSCSRYPNVIDLSRDAFKQLAPLSLGRLDNVSVTPIGAAPTDRAKSFLSLDTFKHLGVTLSTQIPTIAFSRDTLVVTGKIDTGDQYVLIYVQKEGIPPVNKLVKVAKDKTFRGYITLPDVTGDVVFVVARGNSFDTDKYATLSLISPSSLNYPTLPENSKVKITPKLSYNSNGEPMLRLVNTVYADLKITQGKKVYEAHGSNLLLNNLTLSLGKASVKISGYAISTPSSLDRSMSYPNLYSGSILLERSHDTLGGENVIIQNRTTFAKFRFRTPSDYRLRGKYYITAPNGEVKEIAFARSSLGTDGFLLPGVTVSGSIVLDTIGTYLLEIVREDGIAFANIPITRGQAWPIIDPLSELQISTIRTDRSEVIRSTLLRINDIRNTLGKTSVTLDDTLGELAQAKVDDMIRRGYQGHADPDGNYIDYLAMRLGIDPGGSIGENIGYGTVSDLSLQDGLEESGVHRMNMLQNSWTRVGIGYGVNNGRVYLVHVFGE